MEEKLQTIYKKNDGGATTNKRSLIIVQYVNRYRHDRHISLYHSLMVLSSYLVFTATETDFSSPHIHCKKRLLYFPSPAGMSLTKLSLAGNNLITPGQGEVGK